MTQAGITSFPDKVEATPTAPTDDKADLRASTTNVESHINSNYSSTNDGTQAADIAMLHSKGVEVDDEDVHPENIAHPTPATGRWEGDPNITSSEGR